MELVQEVERPTHWLAIWAKYVEAVEAIAVAGIERAGHNAVNSECRDGETTFFAGGRDHCFDDTLVVNGGDADPKDIVPRDRGVHAVGGVFFRRGVMVCIKMRCRFRCVPTTRCEQVWQG